MVILTQPASSLFALICLLPVACMSQTFSLSGYAINGLSGGPMSEVKLHLEGTKENVPESGIRRGAIALTAAPDSDGHFVFAGLSAGHYELQAELPHDIVTYGDFADPLYLVGHRSIEVGTGWDDRTIFFRIEPRAVLSGTIRNRYGDPIGQAGIEIYRSVRRGPRIAFPAFEMLSGNTRRGGRIGLVEVGRTGTDDQGRYRLEELWPGNYVICASPPAYRRIAPSGESAARYRPGTPAQIYARSCYPDPESPGAHFRIDPGTRPHLDFTLDSTPSYNIRFTGGPELDAKALSSGRVWPLFTLNDSDATGSPVDLLESVRLPSWGAEVRNVPPGNYVVETRVIDLEGPGFVARREFTVSDGPPAPIELPPIRSATIDVHILDGDGMKVDDNSATVSFVPASDGLLAQRLRKSSGFSLDPGTYWLLIRAKPPLCAASAQLAGKDVMQHSITAAPGMTARLDVELGRHCGSIGIQTVVGGIAAPFSEYLLLLSGTPQEPGEVIAGTSDAKGHASIGVLPPGRYLLWAWLPGAHGYLGPDLADAAVKPVEAVVTSGQTASILIEATRGGSK